MRIPFISRLSFLVLILILTFFMLLNPRETVAAAASGAHLWYSVLLPALLPFFIAADLLVSTGLVAFLGVLLEPVMRPLFRLPGCSSLVIAMGFTSGFPIGAILTRRLYDEKMLSASEAERLVSFTNNSSPLFILGAVGVGMLTSPLLGYVLAFSHYLANILVGIFWGLRVPTPVSRPKSQKIWAEAWNSLKEYKSATPGQLLGDAIKNSLNNILAIAGFVIFFSLLTRMLAVTGLMQCLANFLSWVMAPLGLNYTLAYALCTGFFEITLGTRAAAAGLDGSVLGVMLVISMILAFSGCSIIAQVMSILSGMPVRLSFYLLSRGLQMILSLLLTLLLYTLMAPTRAGYAFAPLNQNLLYSFNAWTISLTCLLGGLIVLLLLAVLSMTFNFNNHRS
ncbi:MAG TPA: nucleoside recognition domain-containing protein [Syntrophomonadaceae bacterium]|nr:nucleoside recognition domain-containing protein [Syntrophomonadaceae bacterium]